MRADGRSKKQGEEVVLNVILRQGGRCVGVSRRKVFGFHPRHGGVGRRNGNVPGRRTFNDPLKMALSFR